MFFPEFNPESKVWIYTANRNLSEQEVETIQEELDKFVPEWAAHGSQLYGGGLVYKNRFVILAVDESKVYASGCSIDTSVHFIKDLGTKIGVDFFNRLNMVLETPEGMKTVHMSELENYMEAKVYNPMITTLKDLNENWLIPVAECPFV